MEGFTKAEQTGKRHKMFIFGPEGTYKTRTALKIASMEDPGTVAVIDTEFGTDHYANEFKFLRLQSNDPDTIYEEIKKLVATPGKVKTLILDTFSIYYAALVDKYVEIYTKRERTGPGYKVDYYILQPRDYNPINRDASRLVRLLLKSDLNIICICQVKDKYKDMKVIGQTYDGWKKLGHYFDTLLEITRNDKDKKLSCYCDKDRSYTLKKDTKYDWKNDKEVGEFMVKNFRTSFTDDSVAAGFSDDAISVEKVKEELKEQFPGSEDVSSKTETKEESPVGEEKDESTGEEESKVKSEKKREPITNQTLAKYKQNLKLDRKEWDKLLIPYKVTTAKDLTEEQRIHFCGVLMQMSPEDASTS